MGSLIVGGQPLQVPVVRAAGKFEELRPQNSYEGELRFANTYEVPVAADAEFQWRGGYQLGTAPHIRARRFFTVEGHLDGLGYMAERDGLLTAASVIGSR